MDWKIILTAFLMAMLVFSVCAGCAQQEDTEVAAVREKVQALPTVEQFRSLNAQAQRVAYLATQTAYDAYLALDEAQQARLEEELETIKALFSYYNTQIMPLG